jgi:hypothetical protein
MEDQVALPLIQPVFDVRRHMPTLEKCIGQDQATLFIALYLRHASTLKCGQGNLCPVRLKQGLQFFED